MKASLLYKDSGLDLVQQKLWNEAALIQDLELGILFKAMADGDDFLLDNGQKAFFSGMRSNRETILYRQDILKDCLNNASVVRQLYQITVDAIERWRSNLFSIFTSRPSSILSSSRGMMEIFLDVLRGLRQLTDQQADGFASEGFKRLFNMLRTELTDDYFIDVEAHLEELGFREGILMSAGLGAGNKGNDYVLRRLPLNKRSWWRRFFPGKIDGYYFSVHPRDESGLKTLSTLKDQAINQVANVLAQSNDHILAFFNGFRSELAFYVGCLNLYDRIKQLGEPCCFPQVSDPGEYRHDFSGLFDICLSLSMDRKIVSNDLRADNARMVVITGANQGGKSTFLRSVGVAQLMLQAGMFVPAESFCANVCKNLFTHFKREEDITMESGKFDEELSRMNDIADHLTPYSMVLFNESFAATNEREGSEIARQIVNALIENDIKIFFVTHLYEFAHGLYNEGAISSIFLRAERRSDTVRSFKLRVGEPLPTSFGIDLYNTVFTEQ